MAETVTLTLTEFLRARLDEDEQTVADLRYTPRTNRDQLADPADPMYANLTRALRDIEAKRRIVELHPPAADEIGDLWCGTCTSPSLPYGDPWPCPTLRALALPYAVHPGCRDEWRP